MIERISFKKLKELLKIKNIRLATEEEIYKLCHYSNLQPLWAIDNLIKNNKIIEKV